MRLKSFSLKEMLDGSPLSQQLVSGGLDGGLGELVIEVETHDGRVVSRCRGTWEGEHETFGDAIKTSISLEADRLPLV